MYTLYVCNFQQGLSSVHKQGWPCTRLKLLGLQIGLRIGLGLGTIANGAHGRSGSVHTLRGVYSMGIVLSNHFTHIGVS